MDFKFSGEQEQFRDALRRYLEREYAFDARQKIVTSAQGIDDKHWAALSELGLMALPVPEAQGGFDGGPVDMLVVMHELGRALVVEPYWATAVGIEALRLAKGEHAEALLGRAAAGEIKLSVAFHEPRARYDILSVDTHAVARGDGFALNGVKSLVQHGAQADVWIVPAKLNGDIALFAVERDPASASSVAVSDYRTIDGQRAATLTFTDTPAHRLVDASSGAQTLERIADYATFLMCAEAVGALDALNHATVEYTKERKQFGTPIARFQALQHKMVEMLIHAEQARSITYLAAANATSDNAELRRRAVSAAKVRVGQAAKFVGQNAIQLHGGMGMTNEVAAAHWFKRLSIIENTLGDTDHHLARFASLEDFADIEPK